MRCHIVKNTLLHIVFSAILPAGTLLKIYLSDPVSMSSKCIKNDLISIVRAFRRRVMSTKIIVRMISPTIRQAFVTRWKYMSEKRFRVFFVVLMWKDTRIERVDCWECCYALGVIDLEILRQFVFAIALVSKMKIKKKIISTGQITEKRNVEEYTFRMPTHQKLTPPELLF